REIHPDNDSGLINDLLWRYCRQRRIKLSRSRPYKKNGNAWVEQRNWMHVRKVVGYGRFDTTAELAALRAVYAALRLHRHFFQPTMKLKSKERSTVRFTANMSNRERHISACWSPSTELCGRQE